MTTLEKSRADALALIVVGVAVGAAAVGHRGAVRLAAAA